MGNLTIRNLDEGVIETLKAQAKANQRSLEAEVRYVLTCLRLAGSAPDTSTLIGGETSNMTVR